MTLTAKLSDSVTVTESNFLVTFQPIIETALDFKLENRAPKFLVKVQDEYLREKSDVDTVVMSINIGSTYDLD